MNKKPINSNPTKEFFQLLKTIDKSTKNQAKIKSYNPDDVSSFVVEICPKKGLYQHAKFLFQIQLYSYPREFPNVICLSDIYHPNIEHGEGYHNVCLNLFDNWNRSFGLIDVIQGLIFLLYQPNLSDPISSFFNSKNTNDDIFRKNVYTSLHGGTVDGIDFLPNPGICEKNEKKLLDEANTINEEMAINSGDGEDTNDGLATKEIMAQTETKQPPSEETIYSLMTNNNAAQFCQIDVDDSTIPDYSKNANTDANTDANGQSENIEDKQDDFEEEDENFPIREVISPNAFYSDLICSRYAQPDVYSEYDTSEIWDTSIICDNFGFPSSSYVSADSDFDDNIDFLYYANQDDVNDDQDDDNHDILTGCISVPSNTSDPSYIFLRKWVDLRRNLHMHCEDPKPITTIILTDILNPFRHIFGTFLLCGRNTHTWGDYMDRSVYRVNRTDQFVHWMVWVQNVSRWAMNRIFKLPMLDWGIDNLIWYSLFVGLSFRIDRRLREIYNCNVSSDFTCLYIK